MVKTRWFRRDHSVEWRNRPRPWVPIEAPEKSSAIFLGKFGIMNEGNTWEWLRDVTLPLGHYSRIESPDTSPGVPDVHYQVAEDCCGWMELKMNPFPCNVPFPDEEKGLHKSQLKWIKDNVKHEGTVWIIAETVEGIYLIPGREAPRFNGADHVTLVSISVGVIHRRDPQTAADLLRLLLHSDIQ